MSLKLTFLPRLVWFNLMTNSVNFLLLFSLCGMSVWLCLCIMYAFVCLFFFLHLRIYYPSFEPFELLEVPSMRWRRGEVSTVSIPLGRQDHTLAPVHSTKLATLTKKPPEKELHVSHQTQDAQLSMSERLEMEHPSVEKTKKDLLLEIHT